MCMDARANMSMPCNVTLRCTSDKGGFFLIVIFCEKRILRVRELIWGQETSVRPRYPLNHGLRSSKGNVNGAPGWYVVSARV